MTEHPEAKPENLEALNEFRFSLKNVDAAERDLQFQAAAFNDRIQKIIENAKVNEIPVLGSILGLTHEKEELQMLGNALLRIAPLVETYDELKKKQDLLSLAKENPAWLAWAFGDFDLEIDAALANLERKDFL